MTSNRVTLPREDLPSHTFWKKVSWPMPQPEMTPRPVTTTLCFVAERAVDDDVVVAAAVRTVVVDVGARREKADTLVVAVHRKKFRGDDSFMVVVLLCNV